MAALLLLGGLTVLLTSANHHSRQELEQGVKQRAKLAAALLGATFDSTINSTNQTNPPELSAAVLTPEAVRAGGASVATPGMIIGPDRRVLAAWPPGTATPGRRVAPELAGPVGQVLGGRSWVIDVDRRSGQLNLITGFDTKYGRRVSVRSLPQALLRPFLGPLLERVRTGREDNAFLIDAHGAVLGSAGDAPAPTRSLPQGASGTMVVDGRSDYYVRAPISATDWEVVVTVTRAGLYAPITGTQGWLPWVLLAGFALMAGVVVLLTRRLARGAAELTRANARLETRNEQVVAADRMKSEFLATMSHELRTPLNGIIGFAELMHDGRVGPVSDRHKEYLGDILSSSTHLRRLIDDTLDLAKIEAGKIDLRPEVVDPGRLIGEVVDGVASLAARKQIDLRVEIDPRLGELVLDPGKLRQVLFNYLSNALKFTPEGGRVTLRAGPEDEERVRITVEDTGPGIDERDLERLWTAFEQLDGGPARRYDGTGLGLSLTRQIVEAQGGEVGVQSVVGEGSRFHVIVPRVARDADDRRPALV